MDAKKGRATALRSNWVMELQEVSRARGAVAPPSIWRKGNWLTIGQTSNHFSQRFDDNVKIGSPSVGGRGGSFEININNIVLPINETEFVCEWFEQDTTTPPPKPPHAHPSLIIVIGPFRPSMSRYSNTESSFFQWRWTSAKQWHTMYRPTPVLNCITIEHAFGETIIHPKTRARMFRVLQPSHKFVFVASFRGLGAWAPGNLLSGSNHPAIFNFLYVHKFMLSQKSIPMWFFICFSHMAVSLLFENRRFTFSHLSIYIYAWKMHTIPYVLVLLTSCVI